MEENTAAAGEMLTGATEPSQTIDSGASVAQQNGACIEEITALVQEPSAQGQEVSGFTHAFTVMTQK